jgi:hypothetical protein
MARGDPLASLPIRQVDNSSRLAKTAAGFLAVRGSLVGPDRQFAAVQQNARNGRRSGLSADGPAPPDLTQTGPILGRRLDRNSEAGANRSVGRLPLDEYRRAKFQPPRNPRIAA